MTFELAPVDGLNDDELKEMANLFAAKCQKAAQQTVKDAIVAGNALNELKGRVKHGEWRAWLKINFDFSTVTAFTYMTLAANVKRLTFEPTSIRAALRAIADEKEQNDEQGYDEKEVVPRSERKTDRVQVTKPEPVELSENPGQLDENAVPAEPKTNTLRTPATRRAREADRPVPAPVTPEIVDEPEEILPGKTLSDWSVSEMLAFLKDSADDPKKRAKELRKAADELDPPKKFRPPDVEDVRAYCIERKNKVDAEAFVAFYAQQDWRMANGNKISDWKQAVITWEKRDDSGSRNSSGGRVTTGRIKPPAEEPKITFV